MLPSICLHFVMGHNEPEREAKGVERPQRTPGSIGDDDLVGMMWFPFMCEETRVTFGRSSATSRYLDEDKVLSSWSRHLHMGGGMGLSSWVKWFATWHAAAQVWCSSSLVERPVVSSWGGCWERCPVDGHDFLSGDSGSAICPEKLKMLFFSVAVYIKK